MGGVFDIGKCKYEEYVLPRLEEIGQWAKKGATDKEIARNLGIGTTTLRQYRADYKMLDDAIKKGKHDSIEEVENALFKNATGFYYYVDELVKVKNGDGSESVKKVRVRKFKAPETAAEIFFLKNRGKQNWNDNPQLIDLRREEFEHKKKIDEVKDW